MTKAGGGAGVLFDADYVTVEGRAWVRLFVLRDGRMDVLHDRTFDPYFYAVPSPGVDAGELVAAVRACSSDRVPARVEVVERTDGLSRREVVRVVARHPGDVPPLRERVGRVRGVASVREADVLFANRYVMDKGLVPMEGVAWRDAGREGPGAIVEEVRHDAAVGPPPLKLLAFDLEVHNPRIVPDPRRDPVIIASLSTGAGREEIFEAEGRDDAELLRRFVAAVKRADPDVILTYNGDHFDWPYLRDRCRGHGIPLDLGRDGSPLEIRSPGQFQSVRVAGRANVDLYRIAQRDLPSIKLKTLGAVSEALGVVDRAARTIVPKDRIHEYWDDAGKRPTLLAYARDDVRSTFALGERLLPLQIELARLTRLPLDEIVTTGRGRQVDWFLLAEAAERGLLAPPRGGLGQGGDDEEGGDDEAYEGGFVLAPSPGVHEKVQALDFSAMYPTIMISYNVSPETLVEGSAPAGVEVHEAPGVGHRFRAAPQGFFPRILSALVERRREMKKRMRATEGAAERDLLDIRQQVLKTLTNSFYGYTGWRQARWYRREAAEATAAWGRQMVKGVIAKAEGRGLKVLYSDTDSLFVGEHPGIQAFLTEVNEELPIDLEPQESYERIFFTEAKKRYAGLTREGKVVVRGLEVRRGDWCPLAQRLQQEVIETILRQKDPQKAVARVREVVQELRAGVVPLADLTIHKTLTMKPAAYKAKQPHAEAVVRAERDHPDYRPPIGGKIAYVIVRTAGRSADEKLFERARVVEFLKPTETPDAEYYVEKQIVPTAMRVLGLFKVTPEELKGRSTQRTLKEYF